MAKPIYISNADIEDICEDIKKSLSGLKCYGNVNIKRSFKSDNRIAAIYFTEAAWIKMTALVSRFDTEVQWHGMVQRVSDYEFEIYDIVVPPHEVSGTTVTSEYAPYGEWMDGLDDESFNAMRFHGHSHVNMSVSPSSTDEKYRLDLVTQLPKPMDGDDVFYIFLIINKRHEWSAEIYDLTNNALYETSDIDVSVFPGGEELDEFIAQAKKVAVSRTTTSYTSGASGIGYGSYWGGASAKPAVTGGTTLLKKENDKKKRKESGDVYGELRKFYAEAYGWDEDWPEDTIRNNGVGGDDDDDPSSPFYVKEY